MMIRPVGGDSRRSAGVGSDAVPGLASQAPADQGHPGEQHRVGFRFGNRRLAGKEFSPRPVLALEGVDRRAESDELGWSAARRQEGCARRDRLRTRIVFGEYQLDAVICVEVGGWYRAVGQNIDLAENEILRTKLEPAYAGRRVIDPQLDDVVATVNRMP